MVRTELYINGANGTDGYLSFPFGVNIPVSINFNLADVRNPEQRKASRSQTINLLGTNEVNKLFENLFEVNVVTQYFNKNLKTPVRYLVDGLENFTGDMQLIKINIKPDNSIVYECSIIGEGGSLFVDIGEKLIVGNPLTVATSGLLFVGREYTIKDFISGDDFSNVATVISGTINTDGCIFIANGITPNVWSNQSTLTSLEDLDFSAYDHNYTRVNQIASRTTYLATGTGYTYPFIDRGTNGGSGTVWNVKDFLPCFSIYEYIKKIIENTGRTFTSTFLESSFFKHLYCYPNMITIQASIAQLNASKLYVGLTSDFNIIESNPKVTATFNDESTGPFFDLGNQNLSGIVTLAFSKNFNVVTHDVFKLRCTYSIAGCTHVRITGYIQTYNYIEKSANGGTSYFNLTTPQMGYLIPMSSYSYDSVENIYQVIIPINTDYISSLDNATGAIPLSIGDKLRNTVDVFQFQDYYVSTGAPVPKFEYLDYYGDPLDPDFGTATLSLDSGINGSTMYMLTDDVMVSEGDLMSVNLALPTKIKQKEFLTSIFKAFNLFVEPNPNDENDLIIEPFDEFYNTTDVIDYENRTDLAKDQTINPNLLEGKRYIYSYKEDKDYYNDLYKKTWNEVFGTEQIDVDNDFIKSDKKTELIFSATPLVANYDLGIAMPQIYTLDGVIKKTIAANIRLIYCDVKTSPNPYTYKQSGLTDLVTNEYLHGGMEDDALNPTVSLMFGPAKEFYYSYINAYFTSNTLYNAYHKQYVVNLIDKDGKFVTKYLWLTPKDINQFSFRNRLFIDGAYYIVNKIENYTPLDQTSTKVELIKLLKSEVFVPEQFLISDSPINAGNGVATARLNSSLNVGTNIQNRGTNCLAVGENIVIPESCNNLIVFGSNITADENSTGLLLGYKSYIALISQTGTSAPTAIVLNNTLGNVTFNYISVGNYEVVTTGLFTGDKTFAFIPNSRLGTNFIYQTGINTLQIVCRDITSETPFIPLTNGLLNKTSLEIRVYN